MKKLYILAKICETNRPVLEALIKIQKSKKIQILYELLYSRKGLTNYEATQLVYGSNKIKLFSALKSKMSDLLIKTVLTLNVNSASGRYRKVINNAKLNLAARIVLSNSDNRDLAIYLIERSLRNAESEQISHDAVEQVRILNLHYGATKYNKYKLKKYLLLQDKFIKHYIWEVKAERYYAELQRNQLQSLANPSEEIIERARQYSEELESVTDIRSFNFLTFRYRVKAAYLEYTKDYDQLLEISKKTYKEFSTPEFRSNTTLAGINLRIVYALIQESKYDEVIKIGNRDLAKLINGSLGWYLIAHYTLKALLYKGDYTKSIDLISLMLNNARFPKVPDNFKEVFFTTLGFIHLVVDSGLAGEPSKLKDKLPEFKLGKFLNTIPVFSKDKRGINVSIHLMHIAFLLQRKDYNRIIDRVDSLNQYAYRYLRKDDSFRSNCMIKMVIQMTKADFNPIRTERYTRDLRKQLGTITLAGSGENIEVEMIPFEVLWDIMMRALETR